MKILQISNDFFNSSVYPQLHQHLIRQGEESFFFVPVAKTSNIVGNERVFIAPSFHKWDRWHFVNKQKKILPYFEDAIQKIKPEVVHAHFLFSGGYLALQAWKKSQIPYVVAVQNTDVNVFLKYMIHLRSLTIDILRNAKAIVFISAAYRQTVIVKYLSPSVVRELQDKTHVVPFGIDDFWFKNIYSKKNAPESKKIVLLSVGTITKNKNQLSVAKAASRLIKRGYQITYLVVGDVKETGVYNKLKKFDFIKFYPKQPFSELLAIYRNADIFLLPSFHESFGLVYAEALSQGLPIVYTKGQGFDRQLPNMVVDTSVRADDCEGIARKIEVICHNYEQLSSQSIQYCLLFDWRGIVQKYQEIYEQSIHK